jgi:hypothetical protein
MDREGAETQLRLLAEAELRRAIAEPGDGRLLEGCYSARLELVAQALHAVDAFDMDAANEGVRADGGRRAVHGGQLLGTGPDAGAAQAASRRAARPALHRGRRPGHQL